MIITHKGKCTFLNGSRILLTFAILDISTGITEEQGNNSGFAPKFVISIHNMSYKILKFSAGTNEMFLDILSPIDYKRKDRSWYSTSSGTVLSYNKMEA